MAMYQLLQISEPSAAFNSSDEDGRRIFEVIPLENISCWGRPDVKTYLTHLGVTELSLIGVCGLFTLLTVANFLEELVHACTHRSLDKLWRKSLLLLAIYPVTGVTSMLALLMPRVTGVAEFTMSMYVAICTYAFSQLLFTYFGGKKAMSQQLHDATIELRSLPCCCFFCCLPRPALTLWRLHVLEACVMQYVILKPLATFLYAIYVIDAGTEYVVDNSDVPVLKLRVNDAVLTYVTSLLALSTLLAVYGNIMLLKLAVPALPHTKIRAKFYCMQSVLILDTLQKLILNLLQMHAVIVCQPPLRGPDAAARMQHMLLTTEMALLAGLSRLAYRRRTPTPCLISSSTISDVMPAPAICDVVASPTICGAPPSPTAYDVTASPVICVITTSAGRDNAACDVA